MKRVLSPIALVAMLLGALAIGGCGAVSLLTSGSTPAPASTDLVEQNSILETDTNQNSRDVVHPAEILTGIKEQQVAQILSSSGSTSFAPVMEVTNSGNTKEIGLVFSSQSTLPLNDFWALASGGKIASDPLAMGSDVTLSSSGHFLLSQSEAVPPGVTYGGSLLRSATVNGVHVIALDASALSSAVRTLAQQGKPIYFYIRSFDPTRQGQVVLNRLQVNGQSGDSAR